MLVVQAAIDSASPADADSLALTAYTQGRYTLAERAWRRPTRRRQATLALAPITPTPLTSRSNLAVVLGALGRLDEAEAETRAVLGITTRVLGPHYPDTLTSRSNLASVLHGLGRLDEAEAEYRAVLETRTRVLGPDHPSTLTSHNNLALVLNDRGRSEQAEAKYRFVLETMTRVLGPHHPSTLTSHNTEVDGRRRHGRGLRLAPWIGDGHQCVAPRTDRRLRRSPRALGSRAAR